MPAYTGTAASDTLNGSAGADTLTGLAGNDSYLVNHLGDVVVEAAGGGTDTVRTTVLDALKTFSIERWAAVENLIWGGTTAAILKGNAAANAITGNAGADTILGAAGNDTLLGLGGNDSLVGGIGNDSLDGGVGADVMVGETGDDLFVVNDLADSVVEASGGGTDTVRTTVLDVHRTFSLEPWAFVENLAWGGTTAAILKGNAAANVVTANAGSDTLYGAGGSDTLFGLGGNDSLVGSSGNDLLDGGTGVDMMVGGTGNDSYLIDSAGDRAFEYASAGFDTIFSGVAKDLRVGWATLIEGLVYTGTAAATLNGNAGHNRVESRGAAADVLFGHDGNDTLDGGGGNDTLAGGDGDDVYVVAAGDVVDEEIDAGIDTFVGTLTDIGVAPYDITIENLFHTGATSALVWGNALDNVLSGGNGNDTVNASLGNDTVLGGRGADTVQGMAGDDLLYGGANPDAFWVVDRSLVADLNADRLVGGDGSDRYLIDSLLDTVIEDAGSVAGTLDTVVSAIDLSLTRYGSNAIEALVLQKGSTAWFGEGTARGDVLVGNERDNFLVGGAGADTIASNADVANLSEPQSDVLDGGDGDDVLVAFDFGAVGTAKREVTFFGGTGDDFYVIGARLEDIGGVDAGGDDVALLLGSASLQALEGVETIVLYGASAELDIAARAAARLVYSAANGAASIYRGSFGNATDATGNDLDNTIVGNDLGNRLAGGAGNDALLGGKGDDTLDGGTGDDNLAGGTGDDWYVIETGDVAVEAPGAGFDVIVSSTITSLDAWANFEGLQYTGTASLRMENGLSNTTADFLGGGRGDDLIIGWGGNDTLDGGRGSDNVLGGAGNDVVRGDSGADFLFGELGDDTIEGGAGNDSADGGGNWDRVSGDGGNDTLSGGDGRDTLDGGTGDDALYGDNNDDTVVGGQGSDVVRGGGSVAEGRTFAYGDHLWGDEQSGTGGGESDLFVFDVLTADNGLSETFVGSGEFEWIGGATIGDFEQTIDAIVVDGQLGGFPIGNGDAVIDGYTETTAPGEIFASAAELVFVRAEVDELFAFSRSARFDDISAASIGAVLGDADAAIAAGDSRLMVFGDGVNSAVFLFLSADGNATVSLDELYLVSVVTGVSDLQPTDFLFG